MADRPSEKLEEAARILALRAAAYAYNGRLMVEELKTNIDRIRALIDKPPAPATDD